MIAITCSSCGKNLKIKDELAGKKVKCPQCAQVLLVPAEIEARTAVTEPKSKVPSSSVSRVSVAEERTVPPGDPASFDSQVRQVSQVSRGRNAPEKSPDTKDTQGGERGAAERTQGEPGSSSEELWDFLAPAQAPDELGRLGPYRVLKVLGAGGMGVVFKAEDPQLQRIVALKALLPALAASASAKKRFLREARAVAAIQHDHIVTIHQVGEDRGAPFLAMEFLAGEPLDERLNREGALPLAEVLRIGREAAEGLAAAHERGLIHRDIKPANLWLEGKRGRVKILDFGLARASSEETQLTQQGAILGTPAYMAPEQASGGSVDARCDLFSLGCVLYKLCTGITPFHGVDTIATLMAIATTEPPPIEDRNPAVPLALRQLIMQLLAKKAGDRPPSAQAVADALAAIPADRTVTFSPTAGKKTAARPSGGKAQTSAGSSRRTRLALLGGGVGLLATVVVVMVILFNSGKMKPSDPPGVPPGLKTKEPPVIAKTEPLSPMALVRSPAPLSGVRGWTIETRIPRGPVHAVAFNPKKDQLACGGSDGTIRLYQANSGELLKLLVSQADIRCLAWSPDGTTLAAGNNDRQVQLWLVEEGRMRRSLQGHAEAVCSLSWAPDGKRLASGSDDRTIRIWEVESGKEALPVWKGHTGPVAGLAWSPDGQKLASNQHGKTIIWEAASGTPLETIEKSGSNQKGVAWSPDTKRLAFIGWGDKVQIRVWNLQEKKDVLQFNAHGFGPYTVSWSPDGTKLITLGHDHGVKVWEADTGKPLPSWTAPIVGFPGSGIAWASDSLRVAYPTWAGVHVRDTSTTKLLHDLPADGRNSGALTLAPDGKVLATDHSDGREAGTARFWDIDSAGLGRTLVINKTGVTTLAWSPNGKWLAAGDSSLWDLASGKLFLRLRDGRDSPNINWSSDSKFLAVRDWASAARLYDSATGQVNQALKDGGKFDSVICSPDNRWVAAGSDDRTQAVRFWNAATGAYRPVSGHKGYVGVVAFAPDGKLLASGGNDRAVRLTEVESGQRRPPLEGHTNIVTALAWSPRGKILASGSADTTIRLWDTEAGKPLQFLARHKNRIDRLAWASDGNRLASLAGTEIFIWDRGKEEPLHRFEWTWPGNALAWSSDGRTLISSHGGRILALWDTASGRQRCALLNIRHEQGIALTPDGHYWGTPQIERELRYVVQTERGQETLSPEEFATRYSWKNDPQRVRLSGN